MDLLLHQLLGRIQNNGSKVELISLFKTLLTPKEFAQLPKRLEILKQLKLGVKQRGVSKNLKVSIGTITRGSNVLKSLDEKNPKWWFDFKEMNSIEPGEYRDVWKELGVDLKK